MTMKRNDKKIFIKNAVHIHNNKYDYSDVVYLNNKTKVIIKCNKCNQIFSQTPNNHLSNHGCPICFSTKIGNIKRHSKDTFIKKANIVHGYKYIYDNVLYINANTKISILCKKHGLFNQRPSMHLKGEGCPSCGEIIRKIKKTKTLSDFIKDVKIVHGEKYDYSLVNYEKSNKKILIICNEHGIFTQTPNNHLNGAGCPKCKKSKGERNIRNYLDNNNIIYIQQKAFTDCKNKKPLYFDFYISKYNLLIEYDGELHTKSVAFFGGDNGLQYRMNNDKIKNEYVLINNLKLLRINYVDFQNIDNILNHTLNNYK